MAVSLAKHHRTDGDFVLVSTFTAPLVAASLALGAPAPPEPPAMSAPSARRWRVTVGTGSASGALIDLVDGVDCSGCLTEGDVRDPWQLNLRVERETRAGIRLGLAWVYSRWTAVSYDSPAAGLPGLVVVGTSGNRAHSLLAGITCSWLEGRRWEAYSGVATGVTIHRTVDATGIAADDDGTSALPALQIRVIGVTFGWERVRLFAELGVGFEGVLIGGLVGRI